MSIKGAEGMTVGELARELDQGAKIVVFEWCISLLVITLKRASDPYLIRPGKSALVAGLPWTALSLLVGWWGIPWGFIYTPWVVVVNLRGGRDVTYEVRHRLTSA
jgi:hypothetical protein